MTRRNVYGARVVEWIETNNRLELKIHTFSICQYRFDHLKLPLKNCTHVVYIVYEYEFWNDYSLNHQSQTSNELIAGR